MQNKEGKGKRAKMEEKQVREFFFSSFEFSVN